MTLLNHNTIHLTCKLSFITSVQLLKRFTGKDKITNLALVVFPQPALNVGSQVILRNTPIRSLSNNALTIARPPLLATNYRGTRLSVSISFYPRLGSSTPRPQYCINFESTESEIKEITKVVDALNKIKQENSKTVSSTPKSNDQAITLININKKDYTTIININSTPDEFTNEQMLEELKKRDLIKNDDGKTAVTVLNKDNQSVVVGESKNNVKLSQVGQAYYEKFIKSKEIISPQTLPMPEIKNLSKAKIGICIPPASSSETLVEVGLHKHMLLVNDPNDKEYVIVYGYMTSKSGGHLMTAKQIKSFQDKDQTSSPKKHEKPQYFVPCNPPRRLKADQLNFLKEDQEYLKTIAPSEWTVIYDKIKVSWEKGFQMFPRSGITKEDALLICKEYDKVATQKEKGKHPITADQTQINEKNKKMQQEKNEAKKQHKETKLDDK